MIGDFDVGTNPISSQVGVVPKASPNPFSVLSSLEAILEEGELQQFEVIELESEENISSKDLAGLTRSSLGRWFPPLFSY